jgi:hypothetical protein
MACCEKCGRTIAWDCECDPALTEEIHKALSVDDSEAIINRDGSIGRHKKFEKCVSCGEKFSCANINSFAGWKETQISGLCELCFNKITHE